MEKTAWYEDPEDWMFRKTIIFNKNLMRLTFLEIDRLLKLIGNPHPNIDVLDLCCGVGRHSIAMAERGFNVTGVDITMPFLEIAEHNAKQQGLLINFQQSDMLHYCNENAFDLALNLCTSFGYFDNIEDDVRVLQNIHTSLKSNGKFVMEILGKEVVALTFKPQEQQEFEGYNVITTSQIINDWSSIQFKRLIRKDGVEREQLATHRLYSATEMKQKMKEVGFKNLKVYGNFAGAPYDSRAKSMIIIAEK